ncbi:MAG: PQQ-dependent sugar dehydrogenase [Kiloniellaceae bacterium]
MQPSNRWSAAASAALLVLLSAACGPAARAGDAAPGDRFEVRPGDLPPPYATPSAGNRPARIRRPAGAAPRLPAGFAVNAFASNLAHARWLAVAPNGDVFLAEPNAGRITLLRDADGDGAADLTQTFATGFDSPHGMAIQGNWLYVADLEGLWRLPYRAGQIRAAGRAERLTPPGAFGSGGGHWTRNIAFHPDGRRVYVAIGSRRNIREEPAPRATIQEFRADGSGQRTFAAGLRNPVGIAFYPGTEDLYVVVNERDDMGDELVPDYLTRVRDGAFYGWPYAYIGANPQPDFAQRRPDLVARTKVPDLLFRSHSAPLGLVFYDAAQFPPEYRGDAFVALHGSWNAAKPRGYMVARVPFRDRRPLGYYEAFMTGFWTEGEDRARVWGRPAGLAVARDGSLLVADDVSNTVWRVFYRR